MYDTEDKLTSAVKKYLDLQPDVFYYKASERYIGGVSDIIVCCCSVFVALELKRKTGKATALQLRFISNVQKAGGIGGVVFTVGDVEKLLHIARQKGC